jgi:ATP-dependent RNA helicase RhlE
VPGFDYAAKPKERFEVPIGERIAEIRKRKSEERARAKLKAERKTNRETAEAVRGTRAGPGGAPRARSGNSGAPARGGHR